MALTSLSPELRSRIQSCKVLVVGAGGIGCELLKNLVLTGFPDIEVLDLDTIDVSNLNRQFLFQRKHVGRPKAEVAKESCLKFNPNAKITAHCANIMSKDYDMEYFKQFDVVMNALDNRAARRYVNRMCLGAKVPLIESGTSGYTGQVELIYKGLTPCYECNGQQEPKTYPACTIRTTPTEHVHCTIWAKFLFNQLFGEMPDDNEEEVLDIRADGDSHQSDEVPENEKETPKVSPRQWAQDTGYDPEKLFNKLFYDDIRYNLTMTDLWEKRKPPTPISWDQAVADDTQSEGSSGMSDQKMWSFDECRQKFAKAVKALKEASQQLGDGENLVWDKDDDAAMDFVASTANIRAYVYGIERKTRFDIKAMAGNIVPAIATSNAAVAGVIVFFAMKVLEKKTDVCKTVYLRSGVGCRDAFISPEKCFPPRKPSCIVCSPNQLSLITDISRMTLRELEKSVLKGKLKMVEPEVMLDQKVVISSEEGETDHMADKTLAESGVASASILKVEDFFEDCTINIIVFDKKLSEEEGEFILSGDYEAMKSATKDMTPKTTLETNGESTSSAKPSEPQIESEEDDLLCMDDEPSTSGLSAKRATDEESSVPTKKRRTDADSDEDDCIIIN